MAEQAVADYLSAKGLVILGVNVRVGRREIDVLALDGDVVLVIEVRHRAPNAWQSALGSIDAAKARRIRESGERLWAQRFASDPTVDRMRFDVATVAFEPHGETVIEYFAGAL